jgi:hypothetical protein
MIARAFPCSGNDHGQRRAVPLLKLLPVEGLPKPYRKAAVLIRKDRPHEYQPETISLLDPEDSVHSFRSVLESVCPRRFR